MSTTHEFKRTIFSRMLLYNSILTIAITLIITSLFYLTFSKLYLTKIKDSNMQQIQQIKLSLDKEIFEPVQLIPIIHFTKVGTDKTLTIPLKTDVSNNISFIHSISTSLINLYRPYKFLDSIDMFYKNSKLIFDSGHVMYLDDITEKQTLPIWYGEYTKKNQNILWITGENTLTYVRSIPIFKKDYSGIIAININKTYISNILTCKASSNNILIVNNEGKVIVNSHNSLPIPNSDIAKFVTSDLDKDKSIIIDDDKYVVTIIPSEYNDWYYVSIESVDGFYREFESLAYTILLISVIALLVNFIITYLVTKTAHRPFKRIIQNIKSLRNTDIITGKRITEYELIDSTFNNLSSTVKDLNLAMDSNKPIIRYNLIRELINGTNSLESMTSDEMALTDLHLTKPYIFSFILDLHIDDNLKEHNRLNIIYNVISVIESSDQYSCFAIYHNNLIKGAVNYLPDDKNYLDIINTIISQLDNLLKIDYQLFIGKQLPLYLKSINDSYNSANCSLSYSFLYPERTMIIYDELNIDARKDFGSSTKVLKKLEENIKLSDINNVNFIIDGIIMSVIDGNYSITYAKNTLRDVVSRIHNTLIDMGENPIKIFGEDLRYEFQKLSNISMFDTWIKEKLLLMNTSITLRRKTLLNADSKESIITFIDSHIYDDISLEMVADAFNMRTDTFSKTFKALMGQNYSAYIKDIRMKTAVNLLINTEKSIASIAESLGYSSCQYFIKIFKSTYGQTPKQYRLNA